MQQNSKEKEVVILNKIRSIRKSLGYSQEYLAFKLQINQSAYQKLENGKRKIKLIQFLSITEVLEIYHSEDKYFGKSLPQRRTLLKIE